MIALCKEVHYSFIWAITETETETNAYTSCPFSQSVEFITAGDPGSPSILKAGCDAYLMPKFSVYAVQSFIRQCCIIAQSAYGPRE